MEQGNPATVAETMAGRCLRALLWLLFNHDSCPAWNPRFATIGASGTEGLLSADEISRLQHGRIHGAEDWISTTRRNLRLGRLARSNLQLCTGK